MAAEMSSKAKRTQKSGGATEAGDRSRQALLAAAKKLFASKGYRGTVIRDLAEEAGVNLSLISYHFKGKEGLYRACLEEFGKNRLGVAERILRPPETFEEFRVRLQMYLEETVTALLAEPELAQIIQREMELETPLVSDIFENTFLILFKTLVQFFQHAKSKEIIDGSFDVQTVAAMMFSIIAHMTRIDRVNNKYFKRTLTDQKYRAHVVDYILRIFLEGIRPKAQK